MKYFKEISFFFKFLRETLKYIAYYGRFKQSQYCFLVFSTYQVTCHSANGSTTSYIPHSIYESLKRQINKDI